MISLHPYYKLIISTRIFIIDFFLPSHNPFKGQLWDTVTNIDILPTWFGYFSTIESLDQMPLSKGKICVFIIEVWN